MLNGNAIRERDLYTRTRDLALIKALKQAKQVQPKESSFVNNQVPCRLLGPKKKRKIGV